MKSTSTRFGTGRALGLGVLLAAVLAVTLVPSSVWADNEIWNQAEELAKVQREIEENGWLWEAAPNWINALPPSERGNYHGYIPPPADVTFKHRGGVLESLPSEDLPESWDWREMGGTTSPRNQYGCGSCWAFAPVGALESIYMLTTGTEVLFSEQHCISCNEYGSGCNGGQMASCYDLWIWAGSVRRTCMPYGYPYNDPCIHHECDIPVRLNETIWVMNVEDDLKTAIMTHHAIAVLVYASSVWDWYGGGCLNGPTGPPNHCVVLCGWDNAACYGNGAWLVKNSWGTGWGEGGYAWVQFGSSTMGAQAYVLDIELPKEAIVTYRSHEVLDANGVLNPGETVPIAVTVTNYGLGDATNLTGVLTSRTPGVTVIDDTASFDDIGSWRTTTSHAPHFTVQVGGVPPGTKVEFELQVVSDQANDVSAFSDFIGPAPVIYATDFEDGAVGWSHGAISGMDDWQLGIPRVFDNQWDPVHPFSGSHLYGTDLNWDVPPWDGFYPVEAHNYLQSPVIDCSGMFGVHLQLYRWLTSEESYWDVANILVNATEVWRNEEHSHHKDLSWVPMNIDISEYADDNPAVTIRFEMNSDAAWQFGGWNLDDVRVVATCGAHIARPEIDRPQLT
ncbi:MAG: hypothetical protein KAY24_11780, partial [Candidatus Eisenbacteria sp.]|nr:hypothetical protein [Candidatus Eisenbacteria bacterium]